MTSENVEIGIGGAAHGAPKETKAKPEDAAGTIGGPKMEVQPPMKLPFGPAANESQKAFETFLCYFDIGQNRSLARVARESGVTVGTVKIWARRYGWRERVRAYNAHLLETRLKVETTARENQARVWADRTEVFKELEWQAAEKLLQAARLHLEVLISAEPGKVSIGELARALDIASKIGRLATGLATENHEHAGAVDVNLRLDFESAIKKVYGDVVEVPNKTGVKNELD